MSVLSLEQILRETGGTLLAEGAITEFTGLASLAEAGENDVSFLGNEKYLQDFISTQAGAVLVSDKPNNAPAQVSLILVENPTFAFSKVVNFFQRESQKFSPGIHPSAYVSDEASVDESSVCVSLGAVIEAEVVIGKGTVIGPNAVIARGVKIGENCHIHANVTVREHCQIGDRVILQPGCVIGSDGYGYELMDGKHVKIDQVGIVVLEDDVEIGSNTTIDRARFGKTLIGEGTKIDNLVQIAHNVQVGKHCLVVAQSGLAGSSQAGDYVTFAAQSGTAGHLKVHDKAILTARAVAFKDLPGEQVYMGMPARPIKQEQKKLAALARLPKLMAEVKSLKKQIDELTSSSG